MIFSKSLGLVAGLGALMAPVQAEDVLFSKRALQKRQLNDQGAYNMSFFHINDVHSHLDEFRSSGVDCDDPSKGCFGGYARIKTIVDERRPNVGNSLFLNAGDEFQGTLFYTFYQGEKIAETINQLGFDAMCLGNHEFDGGDDELGAYLENITFPILGANIQSSHPVLNKTITPYHIFDEYGVAVIGVTTEETPGISNPGKGTIFTDVVEAVQRAVDEIRSTKNITRIVALTHIGYDEDMQLARATTGIHLFMGGHSHTLLGDMEDAEGKYPTIVENKDGEEVFIVTARRWGEYLGYIDVLFDDEGKVIEYHGGPIHVTNETEQDADLQAQIDKWRGPFEEFAAEELGISNVVLDHSTCQQKECTLGNAVTDAMLAYRRNQSETVAFALMNAGGIRATIDEGPITRGESITSFPFGNAVCELTSSGEEIWNLLEGIVSDKNQGNGKAITSFFQVSQGIRVEYNPKGENGSKLVSIQIGEEDLVSNKDYTFATVDFLVAGGDNFFVPGKCAVLDTIDEVFARYVQSASPIDTKIEGRIVESDAEPGSPGNGTSSANGTSSEGQPSSGSSGSGSGSGSSSSASHFTAASMTVIAAAVGMAFMYV